MKKVFTLTLISIIISLSSISYAEEPIAVSEKVNATTYIQEESGEGVVVGDVSDLNLDSSLISVKIDDKEMTFSIIQGETIIWKGIDDVELSAIKKDERVEIGYYTGQDDLHIASWIDVLVDTETIEVNKLLENEQ
ncbi:MAG: hypothetical protein ABH848_01000 [Candidatus Omnitrophota bacterium]